MNQCFLRMITAVMFVLALMTPLNAFAADETTWPTDPVANNGKKWRLGYLEGGPYANYQYIFRAFVDSLAEMGWMKKTALPEGRDNSETRTTWDFLGSNAQSDYIEFTPGAHWSSGWDEVQRKQNRDQILARLKTGKEIDLMLAFGTSAGQDLANDLHATPTIVFSASNAVQSGIIKSVEDSGYDHIHARVDPKRFERQIRLFHEIVGFKKLGVAFDDNKAGRSYAAIEDVAKVAGDLDFKVIECHVPLDAQGVSKAEEALHECYETLAPRVDAIYITDHTGLTLKNLRKLLAPLFKHNVSMFAQTRYDLVKYGILMGAARRDYKADGRFFAETFAKIMNGAKPRELKQEFESPLKIVINLEAARKIGFHAPLDLLAAAHEIHETIQKPD
ncbi:MAG: ABC transporter substrate-binding protein [Desulfobacterales bacterium]|nr:ABC transporter substrate-binding protein [Desulfobacterales bacterium]